MPVSGALVWEATSYPGHVERRGDADATAGAARYVCAEINAPSRSNDRPCHAVMAGRTVESHEKTEISNLKRLRGTALPTLRGA